MLPFTAKLFKAKGPLPGIAASYTSNTSKPRPFALHSIHAMQGKRAKGRGSCANIRLRTIVLSTLLKMANTSFSVVSELSAITNCSFTRVRSALKKVKLFK